MKTILILIFLFIQSFAQAAFLMPEEAFKPYAKTNDAMQISAGVNIADSIYLYSEKVNVELINSENISIKAIDSPMVILHDEELVFLQSPKFTLTLQAKNTEATQESIQVKVSYQGCSDKGLCYEPLSKTFNVTIDTSKLEQIQELPSLVDTPSSSTTNAQTVETIQPEKELSETDSIADTIKNSGVVITLLTFLGFGFLLALTPCVFPMIPIISGVIISHGHGLSTQKAFLLSVVYVLAMATAYTIAGVLAGLFGSNLQAALQTPWVIYSFAGIFVALALSMFGLYELKAPEFIIKKASEKSHGTGYIGIAIMGFLSALIVGPCVAAPLAGALVYIGQTGDAVLGGMALFSLSIGMGIPLIVVGVSAGKFMPKPGVWMTMVTTIFGVMLLGVAIWMLERVLSNDITMSLYAMVGIGFAIYLGALESGQHVVKKSIAILIFIYSLALLIGVLSGKASFTKPLAFLQTCSNQNSTSTQEKSLKFVKIGSISELNNILKENQGKEILLDFYADWCTSCKELEKVTFSDKDVQDKMNEFILVKADITANSEDNKALSKKYGVFGPPALLFFDKQGKYLQAKTVIGFIKPNDFLNHLQKIK